MENKELFVKNLGELFYRYSRENIEQMVYNEKTEVVTIYYEDGYKIECNVAGNSVLGIAKDICKCLKD